MAAARQLPLGATALVRGTVIAEVGRIGLPPVFVIGDAGGGLPVRLATGQTAPARGALVEVRGSLAAPYGQLELRLTAGGLAVVGTGTLPTPQLLAAGAIGEAVEGRLVTVRGTLVVGASRSGSDLVATLRGTDGALLRLYADGSSGITAGQLRRGLVASVTGIVGQRASRKGTLDGYRLWLRSAADIGTATAASSPLPTTSSSATPGPSGTPAPATGASADPDPGTGAVPAPGPIALAKIHDGDLVTVEGIVMCGSTLLDASGRRTVLEDATGAVELYLAQPDATVRAGARLRVTGTMGKAYGAPRLRVRDVVVLGWQPPVVHDLRVAPGAASEWRLVRVTGTITSLHRAGDRWLAEIATSAGVIPVAGLAGAAIPASTLGEGRRLTVTGIVRRPYPSATDRRYQLVPRGIADLVVGPAPAPVAGGGAGTSDGGVRSPAPSAPVSASPVSAPVADLSDLAAHLGEAITVGGLVTDLETGGVRLDDGTATVSLVLDGEAGSLVALLNPGDAISATGIVEQRAELVVVVADPGALAIAGDPAAVAADADPVASANQGSADASAVAAALAVNANALGGGMAGPGPATMAGGTLFLAGIAGLVAVAAHRSRERRRLRARILTRLASLAAPETAANALPKEG